MKKDEKVIPIIDCPACGAKDVPLSFVGEYEDKSGKGHPNFVDWACPGCGKVLNLADGVGVKRYTSRKELESRGWKQSRPLVLKYDSEEIKREAE